jgi:hypothetical protein
MPLSDASNRVEAPENSQEWKPVAEDMYQVVIKDIDEKIMKKYQSEDEEAFYQFKLVILDGDEESNLQSLNVFCSRKWFGGSKKAQPSKLVTLVKAVYAFYYPKLSVIELEADEMTPAVINDLIGKQIRVAVKINEAGTGNKVTEFMAVRKELAVPEDVKVAAVAKKHLAKPTGEVATADEEKPAKVAKKPAAKVAEDAEESNDPPF